MAKKIVSRTLMTGILLGVFGLGYFCGSVSQQRADAQMPGMGGILEQAGKAGGPLGAASQLASSITEMQEHVTGLQKNIDTLKQVQSSLTGK